MKARTRILTAALIGILSTGALLPANSQEDTAPRKRIYIFSMDFPPNLEAQSPSPPIMETQFWKLLDREMQATDTLALTESLENADYRIDLRCSGIRHCSKLVVDVRDVDRNVLGSFQLKNFATGGFFNSRILGEPDLYKVSRELTIRLDERLKTLEKGDYGHTD